MYIYKGKHLHNKFTHNCDIVQQETQTSSSRFLWNLALDRILHSIAIPLWMCPLKQTNKQELPSKIDLNPFMALLSISYNKKTELLARIEFCEIAHLTAFCTCPQAIYF